MMNLGIGQRTWMRRTIASIDSHRHWLLLCCSLGAAGNSLLFFFLDPKVYDRAANLVASCVFLALALAVPCHRMYLLITNLGLLTGVAQLSFITMSTGGINSPAMVWMAMLPVPALLLLGRRWALSWIVLIMLMILVQFVGVMQGWINGEVNQSPDTLVWALTNKVLVIVSVMLFVNFYERMHHRQMHEVEQGNAQIEATQKALLQAQSHKDEFIAAVGHELRTPMNAILGLNGVLQAELSDQAENVELAEHIRQSTEQLLRLVNDILDYSQLEASRLQLLEQPVHLGQLLQQLMAPYVQRARDKSLALHWDLSPAVPQRVQTDPMRLRQILVNLLDNALKFTHQGHVHLRVKALPERVRFEVEDTGLGIAPERQQQVFKRFEHADVQTNRAYGGTGLGLAICERLVSLQHGRIGVRSALQQGSMFWFELPLQAASAPEEVPPRPEAAEQERPLRFLLVDDNAVNQMVARLALHKGWHGASVVTASSGEQALALLDEQAFDVVLMDMVMPGMDGMETTRRLRQHPRAEVARLRVIGLTANTNGREREQCLHAGMDEVLAKPIDATSLSQAISRLARPRGF